jgi:hypothetical protein
MFKGLTARRLYKSFGVKGLTFPWRPPCIVSTSNTSHALGLGAPHGRACISESVLDSSGN